MRVYNTAFAVIALSVTLSLGAHTQVSSNAGSDALTQTSAASTLEAPLATGLLGRHDPNAVNEISSHLGVVGSNPWQGMQGTGQIVYGTTDSTPYNATLTILKNIGFRLDAQTSDKPISIRILNNSGKIQEPNGKVDFITPKTASFGLFQFPMLRMANLTSSNLGIIDGGLVTKDGAALHKVTLEFPFVKRAGQVTPDTTATDFYFDPTTHLLVMSVNSIRINGLSNVDFLRVITYGDYRRVGISMVPFKYTQTLDGQLQWVLQLSDVSLTSSIDYTFFQF